MAWSSITIEQSDGQTFYVHHTPDEARNFFLKFEELEQRDFDKITKEATHQAQLRKLYGNQKDAKPLKHAEVWDHYGV